MSESKRLDSLQPPHSKDYTVAVLSGDISHQGQFEHQHHHQRFCHENAIN